MLTALVAHTERWRRDAATLWAILRPRRRGASHAATLEAFYRQQAPLYDNFRERLLPGRAELVATLPLTPGAVWVDLGGGTARNLLHAGARLRDLAQVVVVDLTPSLLEVASVRRRKEGWSNVSLVRADATRVPLPDHSADVVTFSYALTMMPEWEAALAEAQRVLKPGGTLGVVDFYISEGAWPHRSHHGRWTRWFWPWWFGHRDVRLNPSHVPTLGARFDMASLTEGHAPVPYVPLGRVPVYRFVGRASGERRG